MKEKKNNELLGFFAARFRLRRRGNKLDREWESRIKKIEKLLERKAIAELDPLVDEAAGWLKEQTGKPELNPEWLNQTGMICQAYTGDFMLAEDCFRIALEESRRLKDKRAEALSLTNLGNLFLDQNRPNEAVEIFTLLKPLAEEHFGDESRETAVACQNLAAAFRLAGDEEAAKSERRTATRILRKLS